MGTPKQLLRVGSRTLLRRSVEEAVGSSVATTIVVVGAQPKQMREELADLPVLLVENTSYAEGIGTSIATGIAAVERASEAFDGVVLLTCDQPHVSAASIDKLIAEHQATGAPLIASAYADTIGIPALFAREYFSALRELPPDRGAKEILTRHRDRVIAVEFEAGAIDIDTPADYERLQRPGGATS